MSFDDSDLFLAESERRGLIFGSQTQYRWDVQNQVPRFTFDLNCCGDVALLVPTPDRVMLFVEIAHRFELHNAILYAVARRSDFHIPYKPIQYVYWHRSYYIRVAEHDSAVSLYDWLVEQGKDPSVFTRERARAT